MSYLNKNSKYWNSGYKGTAANVESVIFRLQGKILKPQFDLPKKNDVCLDFGCGQGASVNYFNQMGYDAFGVDISEKDIKIAKKRYPHIKEKFSVCKQDVFENDLKKFTKNKKISLITCQQSLYFFDKKHFNLLLNNMNRSLKNKGILFASMKSEKHTYKKYSKDTKHKWLKVLNWKNKRFSIKDYYFFFTKSIQDLKSKFKIFRIIHTGSYHLSLDPSETNNYHYTIICQKK
tara:strand:- start:50 stop:748 length:699 start_codon:yes stop_codon:yes gene_type:complete